MAKKKLTATEGPQEPPSAGRKHAFQFRITPEGESNLAKVQAMYGTATLADAVLLALHLTANTPAPKVRPKKSDRPS